MPEAPFRGRVLVIDDQEPTRYIFRRILTHAGYKVEEAAAGAAGLKLAETLPDLIIVDVNLPDMLGYEVCRRLRSNPSTSSIPVLQVSASFVSNESQVQGLEGGADSYLTQPIEPTVLLAQMNALLRLRKAEALSHLSARQWQTTFDSLSDGLALVDSAGVVRRVNRTFLSLLGYAASEAEGRPISEIFERRFELTFPEFLNRRQHEGILEVFSEPRWFRARFDSLQGDPDNHSGSVFLITDITEHKKLQESLKFSERLATTGRLAHIIAHEINNPLEALSNLIYLASGEVSPDSEAHAYMEQASVELVRISQITKQVLAFHRDSKEPVQTRSDELLDAVLAMFRAQLLLSRVELLARVRCAQGVSVHPGEIRQVFSNLLSNGLDAVGSEGGQLRVRCSESTEEKTRRKGVRFTFSDTGPGIPANVLPKVFEAFYTTKESKGSGIGLWLSAEIVARHHGSIRVRTRTEGPYRGTLFAVFLPSPGL